MNAKQFGHFLNLQQQLANLRPVSQPPAKPTPRASHISASAVAEAKDWLAKARRGR